MSRLGLLSIAGASHMTYKYVYLCHKSRGFSCSFTLLPEANCALKLEVIFCVQAVTALVSGNIEAVSGPAAQDRPGTHEWTVWEGPAGDKAEALQEAVSGPVAQDRPGTHEWIVWEGQAADKAEALKCAEKADPRVDLEWMRIRYERDPNVR